MDYAAKVEKDKKMGFVVSFPDLPNVNAFGRTQKEALAQAKDALDGAMESDLELGYTFIYPKTEPDPKKGLFPVALSPKVEIAYKIFEAKKKKKKRPYIELRMRWERNSKYPLLKGWSFVMQPVFLHLQ